MRGKHIKIELTPDERKELENFSRKGKHSVKLVNRAKIILELDESCDCKPMTQVKLSEKIGVSRQAINNAKRDFIQSPDVKSFLKRKKRETPPVPPKVTGDVEAHIIAIACSQAPEGRAKWTLNLIADKCVELQYVDSLSGMTVYRLLKKRNLSLI